MKTVLYIEDSLLNAYLVQAILAPRTHVRFLNATNGKTGMDLARHDRPDLILRDLNLPDMTGDELLRTLRADQTLASIPVVVVSGDALQEQGNRLKDLGVTDYIPKPFNLEEFERVVDRYLKEPPLTV